MPKTIYDLELHEEMSLSNTLVVMRVPGGWVYSYGYVDSLADNQGVGKLVVKTGACIFVPYCDEFKLNKLKFIPKDKQVYVGEITT